MVKKANQYFLALEKHKVHAIKRYCLENNLNTTKFFTILVINNLLHSKFEAKTMEKIDFHLPREIISLIRSMNPDLSATNHQMKEFVRRIITQAVDMGLADINLLPEKDARHKYGLEKVYEPESSKRNCIKKNREKSRKNKCKKPSGPLKFT